MIAATISEGLLRADGYKCSRSGNEREGDHSKSEDFSHVPTSLRTTALYHAAVNDTSRAPNICVKRTGNPAQRICH
jgi:hypothetical protein